MRTIKIPNWLRNSELWRYVGFASSIVGLLCYSFSSTFHYLFGKWNSLKISLYCVFSVILCVAVFFAKKWHVSPSHLFKANLAAFALMLISAYNFFNDKDVKGKPDAFSLISCAAFAIMSLSLSRQTDLGCEVDLLQNYLALLFTQLMKIHFLLGLVGAGFAYFLIILRSSLATQPDEEDEDLGIQRPQQQAVTFPTQGSSIATGTLGLQPQPHVAIPMDGSSVMQQFMACIEALQQSNSNLVDTLLKKAKEYADGYAEEDQIPAAQPVIDYNVLIDALPSGIIHDLREIARSMAAAGLGRQCSRVYSSCRREFLEECLSRLELRKLSNVDVHDTPWLIIKDLIERWIKASNVALKILFSSERRLCDRVFSGFTFDVDMSFMEVCRESTILLLNFANGVAAGSRSPERLFRILYMFGTLHDLIPEFESLFSDPHGAFIKNEAIKVLNRLGEAIKGIFMEFEKTVLRDPAKTAVPGGRVHPITRYVMNYLRTACRSRETLEQVYPNLNDRVASSCSLSVQMASIMELLDNNLEAKSKIYKDPALCYVFMMNNVWYLVQNVKDNELGNLLGDDWIRKETSKVWQYFERCQRSSWNKVLGFLKLEPNIAAESMKERLDLFNKQFEEICRVQSTWFVFDGDLREKIAISLRDMLLPAYRNFIERFQDVPGLGEDAYRYVKYGMEDIEARLNHLFRGVYLGSRK